MLTTVQYIVIVRSVTSTKLRKMTESKKRLSIPVSEQIRAEFTHIAEKHKLTQDETLELLLKTYREANKEIGILKQQLAILRPELTEIEKEELNQATKVSGISQAELVKNGLINEVRTINTKNNRMEKLEKDNDVQDSLKDGSALARINIKVKKIMKHNDNQDEKINKLFISETTIFKMTGSNRSGIKDYMSLYKGKVDTHNKKHDLTANDNLRVKGRDVKTILSKIEEVTIEE